MLPDIKKRMPGVDVDVEVKKKAQDREKELNILNDDGKDKDINEDDQKFTKRKERTGNLKRKVCNEI
jgi:hypothetical protein